MLDMLCEFLNIKRYLSVQRFTFNVIGIDITSQLKVWRTPWLTILTCFLTTTLMISMGHYSLKNLDDMDKVTEALSPFMQILLSIWKVWILIYNQQDVAMLIKRIWMMTIKASKEELLIIRQENLKETALSRSYGLAVLAASCAAVGISLFLYIYTYFYQPTVLEKNIENLTAYKASYLIDPKPLFNYFLIYIWTLCSTIFITFGSVATDTLFCWYVYNIAAQFRVLCLKIRIAAKEQNDVLLESSIRSCIYLHQFLIETCKDLNRIFKLLIFVEFTLNCLQVCFLAYQIGNGVATTNNLVFFVFFMMAVAIQLMIYCYGGQRIQNESECVATEIYCSFQWHQMSIRNKKLLLLPLLRAQNCCYLNAYFFAVDLRMFLLVFRNAASYVSLLWSLDE